MPDRLIVEARDFAKSFTMEGVMKAEGSEGEGNKAGEEPKVASLRERYLERIRKGQIEESK
jgi:hypothetical protein